MAITKIITGIPLEINPLFAESTKIAIGQFDTHVPPEIEQYCSELKPDPRFGYVHMIAMSDGDFYGSNLNGDVFTTDQLTGTQSPEEAAKNTGRLAGICVPRYKTFETAKFFKNHANSSTDPAYGDIGCAGWNRPMRRVELIIRIAREPIPELGLVSDPNILKKYEQRGYLTGSMGTRISHEKCRYCGAENEFIHQRCSHLKNFMNQVMPDGRLVCAENFGCRFFDYSDVGVPADPVAFSLSKVAAHTLDAVRRVNYAEDTREHRGTDWAQKRSEIEKQVPLVSHGTTGDVPFEADVPKTDFVPEYSVDELKAACVDGLPALVGTAALMGIVLSPRELVQATLILEPTKAASAYGDFTGFTAVPLDKFSPAAYTVLRSKMAARSGYVAPCLATGWEPAKIAAEGHQLAADYYAFYRACLSSLPVSHVAKVAARNPALAELLATGNLNHALYHLAHAGVGLPL
jgi:hypothetical protein